MSPVKTNVALKEQTVNVAKARSQQTSSPVSVIAHMDTGEDRSVIFNPDGTNERIWGIDKGTCIQPKVGQVYTNCGGGQFRCIAPATAGPTFYNAAGGFCICQPLCPILRNIISTQEQEIGEMQRLLEGME